MRENSKEKNDEIEMLDEYGFSQAVVGEYAGALCKLNACARVNSIVGRFLIGAGDGDDPRAAAEPQRSVPRSILRALTRATILIASSHLEFSHLATYPCMIDFGRTP